MKQLKKILAIILCAVMICVCFSGCSSNTTEKYSDDTLIIGYTESAAPFIEVDKNGKATGFEPELWKMIFDAVKGDLKNYVFEKVDDGYALEEDGGFCNSEGREFSAGLLFGATAKNVGTFNEDYSLTEPIVTDRVIAITAKNSKIESYADFKGARAVVVGETANKAFDENSAIKNACKSVSESDINAALKLLDSGKADVVITNEFTFNPLGKAENYNILKDYLDVIEYVIAVPKYSGWKDSINEAIRELKNENYGNGDEFTPIVEKYFGYNASSFNYQSDGDK